MVWVCTRRDCLCRSSRRRGGCACKAIHGERVGRCMRCAETCVAVTADVAKKLAAADRRRR